MSDNTAGPKPESNLSLLLRASLDIEEGRSPLAEADPNALDELYERINSKLAAGMPHTIDRNTELLPLVHDLMSKRFKFVQDQQKGIKAGTGTRRTKAPAAEAQELSIEDI